MSMTTPEVAMRLASLCRELKFEQAAKELYSADIVSVEAFAMPGGLPRTLHGMEAVKQKTQWWMSNFDAHSCSVSDPFLAEDKFAVIMELDTTEKKTGERKKMKEVAVYTVKDGKIVHEEFLFSN